MLLNRKNDVLDAALEGQSELIAQQREKFEAVDRLTELTAAGASRSLIIAGPPGVGKSYGVNRILKRLEARKKIRLEFVKGNISAVGLYLLLYEMRHKNCVTVFDDSDAVFRDETALNVLKGALDSEKVRRISWRTKTKLVIENDDGEEETVPKSFDYAGSVIFITNVDFEREVNSRTKLSPHFEALMSRSHYINIDISTAEEKMVRLLDVVNHGDLMNGLNMRKRRELTRWLLDHQDQLREVSLRMVVKLVDLIRGEPSNWESLAAISCLKKA